MNLKQAAQFLDSKRLQIGTLALFGPKRREWLRAQAKLCYFWRRVIPKITSVEVICVNGKWNINAELVSILGADHHRISHLHSFSCKYYEILPRVPLVWNGETQLSIIHIDLAWNDWDHFIPSLCNSTKCLKKIVITDCDVREAHDDMPGALLKSIKTLEHIDFYYNYSSASVLQAISMCENLTYLRILGCKVGQTMQLSLLRSLRKLESLDMELLDMGAQVQNDLEELLRDLPSHCCQLSIKYDHFNRSIIDIIANIGSQFEELSLGETSANNVLSAVDFAKIYNACTKLRVFKFDMCCARVTPDPLMKNDSIRYLYVYLGDQFLSKQVVPHMSSNLKAAFCGRNIFATPRMTLKELKRRRRQLTCLDENEWLGINVIFLA